MVYVDLDTCSAEACVETLGDLATEMGEIMRQSSDNMFRTAGACSFATGVLSHLTQIVEDYGRGVASLGRLVEANRGARACLRRLRAIQSAARVEGEAALFY